MAKRSERRTEITGQGADVGPLADQGLAIGMIAIGNSDQPQRGDLYRPCR